MKPKNGTTESRYCHYRALYPHKFVDNGSKEPDGIILGNVVVEALGEEDHVVAVWPLDMVH